jgi:hypothetical protein
VGVHGEYRERLRTGEGTPISDDDHGRERGGLAWLASRSAIPETKPVLDPSVRERWNDYGIGLLLQGDIKNAEATFQGDPDEPSYADGWSTGRARVGKGMAGAEEVLRGRCRLTPNWRDAFSSPRH